MAKKNNVKASKKGLTDKQKRFCNEYLIDLNATQAAIRAGYSSKTAYRTGNDNLKKPQINEYIKKRMADRSSRTEITQDFVIKELMNIASAKATDYAQVVLKEIKNEDGEVIEYNSVQLIPTEDLSEEQKKRKDIIKKGKDGYEVRPYDKLKALELLGKHLGLFNDKEKLAIEREKLAIERERLELEKQRNNISSGDEDTCGVVVLAPILEEDDDA